LHIHNLLSNVTCIQVLTIMSIFSENIDNIIEEVLEDLITAVVLDSNESQIETTVQSVLEDIVAIGFSYGDNLPLDIGTDEGMDKDRRMVDIVDHWSTLWFTLCRKRYPPCHTYSPETYP